MNIIKGLVKYTDYEDMLETVYGISTNNRYDYILVAPSWDIDKIFKLEDFTHNLLCDNRDCKTYEMIINGKRVIYITLKIGAPNMMDFCLMCHNVKCDNFIFLGSAGALVKGINLGDIIVPQYSISGDGASMYLYDKLDANNFLKKAYPNEELSNKIINTMHELKLVARRDVVITIDSIAAEYSHLKEFVEMGATIVEMEAAAFFNAMNYISKRQARY